MLLELMLCLENTNKSIFCVYIYYFLNHDKVTKIVLKQMISFVTNYSLNNKSC